MRFPYKKLVIVLLPFVLFNCKKEAPNPLDKKITALIETTQKKYVADRRTSRFEAELTYVDGQSVLKGITTNPVALTDLKHQLDSLKISIIDSVQILPTENLKDKIGVVHNSVANIRTVKGDASEMASQALLGTPVKMLQQIGNWYLVQTPDAYLGWIYGSEFTLFSTQEFDQWLQKPKLIFTDTYGRSYASTTNKAGVVSDLVAGDILILESEEGDFYEVSYPDGRKGHISKSQSKPYMDWLKELKTTNETLVQTSKQLLGVPYLWGGTSIKGVDCSGFTKTVYFLNGIILPRDASQQVIEGLLIDDQKHFSKLQPGDLLFFGRITPEGNEKVVHVGMWIGNNEFIHSSGRVKIGSMDTSAANFDEANFNRYLRTKRILGQLTQGTQKLENTAVYSK